jgi:hypothetical protein
LLLLGLGASYAVNLTGFGRNITSSIVVSDAAGNSTGPTAGNTTVVDTDNALVLTIAEFNTFPSSEWVGNPVYTSVTVKDLPANFAALTGADIADLEANGVTAVGSSSGNLVLTVDQYTSLGGLAVNPPAKIVDTAAHIEAMTTGEFAGMAGKNVKVLQYSDAPLTIGFDQFNNLNGVKLPSDRSTTLQATEANIEGLSASQINALSTGYIGHISAAGNVLNLGLDQFSSLGSAVLDSSIALTVTGDVAGVTNDIFTFSKQPFSVADKVNGVGGTDTLSLTGDYGSLGFLSDTISSIEKLKLNGGGHSYDITENNANVGAGQTFTVAAVGFGAGDSLVFDGSAETDGIFSFTGGAAGTSTFTGGNKADTITAGAGADTIRYSAASQSNSSGYDIVNGFDAAADSFSWTQALTFDSTVASGRLNSTTLETNLTTAFAGVAANHAKAFQATTGNMAGQVFLLINDASVGYQTGDLVVRMNNTTGALSDSNFKVG